MSKKFSKYTTAFDYIDEALIVFSAANGEISIISYVSVIGVPAGRERCKFYSCIFFDKRNDKDTIRNNKK